MSEAGCDQAAGQAEDQEDQLTFTPALYIQRYSFAYDKLFKANPPIIRMADFGCAEGKFIEHLKQLPFLQELSAVDVDVRALSECEYRAEPKAWNYIFPRFVSLTINLTRASVSVRDPTFQGLDAVSCIELIEHLPADVLEAFPDTVFGYFRPRIVIISTPNVEFNVLFPQLKNGKLRHWDHRFEWTRAEFQEWCKRAADSYRYSVTFDGVGDPPAGFAHIGHCSQIAVFERLTPSASSTHTEPVSCTVIRNYTYPQREKGDAGDKPVEPFDWSFLRDED